MRFLHSGVDSAAARRLSDGSESWRRPGCFWLSPPRHFWLSPLRRICGAALLAFGVAASPVSAWAEEVKRPTDEAAGRLLTFMTEHRPYNNYLDPDSEELVGTSVDIMKAMLGRLGWRVDFEVEAWSRSYALALTRPNTCVFSAVRVAGRDAQFKWVGPFDHSHFIMVARAGSGIQLESIEDARPYRIGVYTQDVKEIILHRLGGFDQIDTASSDFLNSRKLTEGRIDLWFTNVETFNYLDSIARKKMVVVLRHEPLPPYLA